MLAAIHAVESEMKQAKYRSVKASVFAVNEGLWSNVSTWSYQVDHQSDMEVPKVMLLVMQLKVKQNNLPMWQVYWAFDQTNKET